MLIDYREFRTCKGNQEVRVLELSKTKRLLLSKVRWKD